MSKPIQYYASCEHLDKLCERFGYQLDLLDREQKLELRIILSYFIWGQEQWDDYRIHDAWSDSIQHLLIEDKAIDECLEILNGISVRDAESLLEALQAQCRTGNARLKTPVETTTVQLVDLGVPESLAKPAAYITHKIDNHRPRTDSEQALINKVHAILIKGK